MSKFRLLAFALFAVFAFSAVAAATASAEETTFLLAEWLWEKAAVTSALLLETPGELLLEDTFTGIKFLCSGKLVEFEEPTSLGLITELLDLEGHAISTTPLEPVSE